MAITICGGLVVVSAVVLPTRVAGAAVDKVTSCAGSGPGSLFAAVAGAATNDAITFSVSCPTTSPIVLTGTIDINIDLAIIGPGASSLAVSGNGAVGVFDIASGVTTIISGLTIEDGNTPHGDGGGIDNDGTLALTDTTVSDNSAANGGGIASEGSLTLMDCAISDNQADQGNIGGGIFIGAGMATLTDSSVSGNIGGEGGGLGTDVNTQVSINDSTISMNSTENDGGGISNDGTSMTITDSTVSDNSAVYLGGGVFNGDYSDGEATFSNSTFADNTAVNGGGIDNTSTLDVTDSTLSNNIATSDGGGIYNIDEGPLTITNSSLSDNSANSKGGGVYSDNEYGPVDAPAVLTNSTLSGNSATSDGGGISNDGGELSVAATIVANSTSGNDCSGTITDAGYNLDDDGSCGFSPIGNSQSGVAPELGSLQDNGGGTLTIALQPGSPAIAAVNSASLCSTPDQLGMNRPTPCDIGAVEAVVIPTRGFTSSNIVTATLDSPFSFVVTAVGTPLPSITKKGRLPKGLRFRGSDNGTATISGTPYRVGVKQLTMTATFGSGTTKYVITEAFTLTIARSTVPSSLALRKETSRIKEYLGSPSTRRPPTIRSPLSS